MDDDSKVGKSPKKRENEISAAVQKALLNRGRWDGVERRTTDRNELYDLEKEFSATRRNKSLPIKITTFAFLVLVASAAFGITEYIRYRDRAITIDIAEFEDLNLKDLLSSAKRNEKDFEEASRGLDDLKQSLNTKIQDVRILADQEIEVLNIKRMGADERERQIQAVRRRANLETAALEKQYAPEIAAKENEIREIQERIDAYDQRLVNQAKKQEEVLNNQQSLHDLEMQKTVAYYEEQLAEREGSYTQEIESQKRHLASIQRTLTDRHRQEIDELNEKHANEIAALILKYNPQFTGTELERILRSETDPSFFTRRTLPEYRVILAEEGVLSRAELELMRREAADRNLIIERLREIPFENSLPAALNRLDYLSRRLFFQYEDLWSSLAEVIERKNDQIAAKDVSIDHFNYFLASLSRKNREVGYVVDPRETGNIVTYVEPGYQVRQGDIGLVFRLDDELIGTVEFYLFQGELRARVTELEAGKTIEPYDKILLKKE